MGDGIVFAPGVVVLVVLIAWLFIDWAKTIR